MPSLSYIQNSDGSDKSYFDYDPLFFELTKIEVEDYTWKAPGSYTDAGVIIPAQTNYDVIGGTLAGATLTVSSVRNGKQNVITVDMRDDLFDRYLSGEEQTIYSASQNKSYTGFLQMPKFSTISIAGYYTYTLELILSGE